MANDEPMHVYPLPDGGQNALLPTPPAPSGTAEGPAGLGTGEQATSTAASLADSNQPFV